jgi:hypothetical protein
MRWVMATEERVAWVALHLRKQDAIEVFCSHGADPWQAVHHSWHSSPDCRCIEGDDYSTVGIAGISPGGCVWLLATDGLLATASHRRQFLRGAKQWIDALMAEGAGPLHNWVLAKNTTTLRWLRWLGFTVEQPHPMGPCAELFCYVERID